MIFFENQYFFPSHVQLSSASVSLLPIFLNLKQLWNGSNLVLCMRDVVDMNLVPLPLCLLPILTWRLILLLLPLLFVGLLVLLDPLIGMVSSLLSLLLLLYPLFPFPLVTNRPWNMSVGKFQCKQNFKHLRRITLGILFLILLQSNLLGVNGFFFVKLRSDGSLDRYKAHLVALGNKQEYGVDYEETFAHVAKMTTVRTILAIAASQSWRLHQMDMKNVFLHGDLQEEIYMKLPSGMTTSSPHDVCKLRRSMYGLKQAPNAWFEKFRSTFLFFSFTQSQYDSSLFLHTSGIVILLVYVDDIIITGTDCGLITKLQQLLHATFHMKDLGQLTYFLGLEVHYLSHGLFVN